MVDEKEWEKSKSPEDITVSDLFELGEGAVICMFDAKRGEVVIKQLIVASMRMKPDVARRYAENI
jgi:hypothetical protein